MEKRFVWKDGYDVGNELVDSQHRRFFDLANQLYETSVAAEVPAGRLEEHLFALADYAYFHFSTEERFLLLPECANAKPHVDAHNAFRSEVIRRIAQLRAGEVDHKLLAKELVEYAAIWIVNHILVMDKGHVACFSLMIPGDPSFMERIMREGGPKPPPSAG